MDNGTLYSAPPFRRKPQGTAGLSRVIVVCMLKRKSTARKCRVCRAKFYRQLWNRFCAEFDLRGSNRLAELERLA
ncbi:hypothetical protein BpHYR1_005988 [Brachionus plicatilis]|uniref:Uncharacterized protein n=1 Tax=Brachionus plicatilis TaxID=10195 RepID=A0A3M7SWN9_BRAPC|nr:hypothetical protein BpHYR1_005988 [Brachionus plicatilis]